MALTLSPEDLQAITDIINASASTISDGIWDEPLTAATHNVPTSSGRRLRQLAPTAILDGIITSGTTNSVTFDGDASTINGTYDPAMITIMSGSGIGQTRLIYQYDGATKKAWVDRDWKVVPQNGDTCVIASDPGREHVNEGVVRSGSALAVQLNANASTEDGEYVGQVMFVRSGTGSDQARRIIAYDGTNQIAHTRKPWTPQLDNTSVYVMLPTAELDIDKFINSVWEYYDRTLTQISSISTSVLPIQSSTITLYTYSTNSFSIASISDSDEVWVTIKTQKNAPDSTSIVQIDKTGLIYANGISGSSASGSLVFSGGDLNVTIEVDAAPILTGDNSINAYGEVKSKTGDTVTIERQFPVVIAHAVTKTT